MNASRRTILKLALAGAPLSLALPKAFAAPVTTVIDGVPFGVQTYSFREMLETPGDMVDKMIAAMRTLGLNQCELFEPEIQPPVLSLHAAWAQPAGGKPSQASLYGRPPTGAPTQADLDYRAAMKAWRLSTPIDHFVDIRRKFESAGMKVFAFNFLLKDELSDEEVEKGFEITKALGTRIMTASTTLTMAKRTIPFAEKHNVLVAMHGHSNLDDPNQFATLNSFVEGLAMSPLYRVNLDVGHFSAAGFDPVAFIRKYHHKITNLHIKDRKNNDGPNEPFGQGDTPIIPVLQLLKKEHYGIPVFVEYEYAGTGTSVEEVRKCLDYMRAALA